jgi:hypothetical protein
MASNRFFSSRLSLTLNAHFGWQNYPKQRHLALICYRSRVELALLASQSTCAVLHGRCWNRCWWGTRRQIGHSAHFRKARAHLAASCTYQDPRESVDPRTFGTWPLSSGTNQDLQRGVGGSPDRMRGQLRTSVKGSVKFRQFAGS